MTGYLDSSVLLRVLLNQPNKLESFSTLRRPVASKLLRTECLRSLDHLKSEGLLSEEEHLTALSELYDGFDSVEWVDVSDKVLRRAGEPFAVSLGTLDAIHLSSALLWRDETSLECYFLTHDLALQKAARASGFHVMG